MNSYDKYMQATTTATSDAGLSIKNKLAFHLFNPNGLCAIKSKLDAEIDQLVKKGIVPSGWYLAYGSLDFYYVQSLYDLNKKKAPTSIRLLCALRSLDAQNKRVRAKIDKVAG